MYRVNVNVNVNVNREFIYSVVQNHEASQCVTTRYVTVDCIVNIGSQKRICYVNCFSNRNVSARQVMRQAVLRRQRDK